MPVIRSVEVSVARVPLGDPVTFSTRSVTAREYCLVRITSTEGHHGVGYSYAVNSSGKLLADAVADVFAPILLGRNSLQVEGLWAQMYREALLIGRAGAVMRGLSAIDIALWDLNARSVGLALHQFMGAFDLGRVKAYGSGGYYLPGKTPDDLAAEMAGFVAAGHDAVKMKVGMLSPAEEETRVAAAREAIGPDIHLMLDANNAWNDIPTALRYMTRLEKYDPYWIEEPFLPEDIANHAELARRTRVPVSTGEIEAGRWRFREMLEQKAAAIIQADAIVCGGITEWRRIAATASSFGVPVAPHAWHDVHAQLVAATENATYVEFMPDDSIVNFRNLIDTQLELEDGYLLLPETPGIGWDFLESRVHEYRLDQSSDSAWTVRRI